MSKINLLHVPRNEICQTSMLNHGTKLMGFFKIYYFKPIIVYASSTSKFTYMYVTGQFLSLHVLILKD